MVRLAQSKAGHDRGQFFVIVRKEGEYVYLADGRLRPLEKSKRKNKKHIQIIKHVPRQVAELLASEPLRNLEIKRALKLYRKFIGDSNHDGIVI